jgi:hypothetical protein
VRTLVLAFGLYASACHHEDAPQPKLEPGETLPLPPASGTPIGFLLDDATDLSLKSEQIAQLQGIDQALQAQLDQIDTQLRGYDAKPQQSSQPRQGGGGRRGGGGMGGMGQQPQGGGPRVNNAPGANAGSGGGAHQDDIARLNELRKADVKDALGKAMVVFDMGQRILARKTLAKHDVDLDSPDGKPATAQPSAQGGEDGEP